MLAFCLAELDSENDLDLNAVLERALFCLRRRTCSTNAAERRHWRIRWTAAGMLGRALMSALLRDHDLSKFDHFEAAELLVKAITDFDKYQSGGPEIMMGVFGCANVDHILPKLATPTVLKFLRRMWAFRWEQVVNVVLALCAADPDFEKV